MEILFHVIIATIAIGLLEGSEIAMMMVAAASKYKWRTAWKIAFAGLATLVPLIGILYLFFAFIPAYIAGLVAGAIIFLLGAHFFIEGFQGRKGGNKEVEEEDKKIARASLIGVYAAIVLEEAEAGSIAMSVGVAAGGAYFSAILGMLIGLIVPLVAVRQLEPVIERIPEWMIQIAIGTVMMIAAILIIVYRA